MFESPIALMISSYFTDHYFNLTFQVFRRNAEYTIYVLLSKHFNLLIIIYHYTNKMEEIKVNSSKEMKEIVTEQKNSDLFLLFFSLKMFCLLLITNTFRNDV